MEDAAVAVPSVAASVDEATLVHPDVATTPPANASTGPHRMAKSIRIASHDQEEAAILGLADASYGFRREEIGLAPAKAPKCTKEPGT